MSIYSPVMRYNDAICDRRHRWMEDQNGLLAARVTSHAVFGQEMSSELLPEGAFSTV
jgi:hypothetical protein